jgi:hypothetical protein
VSALAVLALLEAMFSRVRAVVHSSFLLLPVVVVAADYLDRMLPKTPSLVVPEAEVALLPHSV